MRTRSQRANGKNPHNSPRDTVSRQRKAPRHITYTKYGGRGCVANAFLHGNNKARVDIARCYIIKRYSLVPQDRQPLVLERHKAPNRMAFRRSYSGQDFCIGIWPPPPQRLFHDKVLSLMYYLTFCRRRGQDAKKPLHG